MAGIGILSPNMYFFSSVITDLLAGHMAAELKATLPSLL